MGKVLNKYPSEHQEQVALINWFRLNYPQFVIVAVPNGGNRNLIEAKKLKEEGVLKGFPDIAIFLKYPKVILLEMKKQKGGVVSKEQKKVHQKLSDLGHTVIVGYGFIDAKNKIEELLNENT